MEMVNFSRDVALNDLTELYLKHPVVAQGKLARPIAQCCEIQRFLWRIVYYSTIITVTFSMF